MSSKKKTPEQRWRGKFSREYESGTLKKHQFDKLSCVDRFQYLDQELRKKYSPHGTKYFGGKYNCETCATLDLFDLPGYLSEKDDDDE